MSLWSYYRNLQPRTRLLLGVGVMAYAGIGIFISDRAESFFGFTPTELDKKNLSEARPRIYSVEREKE